MVDEREDDAILLAAILMLVRELTRSEADFREVFDFVARITARRGRIKYFPDADRPYRDRDLQRHYRELERIYFRKYRGGREDLDYAIGQINSRINRLEETIAASKPEGSTARKSENELNKIKNDLQITASLVTSITSLLSLGGDIAAAKFRRPVAIRVYFPDPAPDIETCESIVRAVMTFAEEIGFRKLFELQSEDGSWWKKLGAWAKDVVTHEELRRLLKKIEEALNTRFIEQPKAKIFKDKAEAATKLIDCLKESPNVRFSIDGLFVVKACDKDGNISIAAKLLTEDEKKKLELDESFFKTQEISNLPPDN